MTHHLTHRPLTASRLQALIQELMDDNPFAIRPVLKLCAQELTDTVPTAAVTCAERPALLVNPDFVGRHCANDIEIKALLCHEFLHVLLRHTEGTGGITPAQHLAFDAVINAIIHRTMGPDWSAFMARYYGEVDSLLKLLRPMNERELNVFDAYRWRDQRILPVWVKAWRGLYDGRLVADDIRELAESLSPKATGGTRSASGTPSASTSGELEGKAEQKLREGPEPFRLKQALPPELEENLLGDHETLGKPIAPRLAAALDESLRQMNGDGIFRSPRERGIGANPYEALFSARPSAALTQWRQTALAVLKRHVTPDRKARATGHRAVERLLPVLCTRDRRAFLRAGWSPFLPEALWQLEQPVKAGSTQIYLDVSGSMSSEMPELIALLGRLSGHIRRPFWAFSNKVVPARIEKGQLVAHTTGGTSMACVLAHVAATRPEAAVVVTDGYIERLPARLVRGIGSTRLHALITRHGSANLLSRARIPYTQLPRMPR